MKKVLENTCEILELLYQHGWDERNGGNLSILLDQDELHEITNDCTFSRTIQYDFDMTELIGQFVLVTGTGKYFKNMMKDPEHNLGIIQVINENTIGIVWGFLDGGKPTSELPTHLKSHIERLKMDKNHKVVIHCHPDNIICMTHICPLDNKFFTETLWKMQTESIVVFPEGVAVLPWILCGGSLIGEKTADLMKEYRSVIWAQHGLFCTGTNLDETFGLIETIEKAASIYMKIVDKKVLQSISNDNLKEIANAFHIDYRKGIID